MKSYETWLNEGWFDNLFGKKPVTNGAEAKLSDPQPQRDQSLGNMYRKINRNTPVPAPQAAPGIPMTNVGFSGNELMRFKDALENYTNIIGSYLKGVLNGLDKIDLGDQGRQLLSHLDDPAKRLASANKWVDGLMMQRNKSYQAPVQGKLFGGNASGNRMKESVVLESVKVNYREFETAKQTIKSYIEGIEKFQNGLRRLLQKSPKLQSNIDKYYQERIVKPQEELKQVYSWFDKKVNQLMQQNQVQKQGGQWQVPQRAKPV